MSAGVMVVPTGGSRLEAHRHAQPELYFIATGSGVLTIDGVAVSAGTAAFIPGVAEQSIRNDGQEELRVFYVFPTDRTDEVVYRFSATAPAGDVAVLSDLLDGCRHR